MEAQRGAELDQDEATLVAARYFDAWNRHDPDAVVAAYTPDGERVDYALGATQRPEDIRRVAEAWVDAFPDFRVELVNAIFFDDEMASEWVFRGTHEGRLTVGPLDAPPTGRELALRGCSVFKFEGGRIRSEHLYANIADILRQLGLLDLHALAAEGASAPETASFH